MEESKSTKSVPEEKGHGSTQPWAGEGDTAGTRAVTEGCKKDTPGDRNFGGIRW